MAKKDVKKDVEKEKLLQEIMQLRGQKNSLICDGNEPKKNNKIILYIGFGIAILGAIIAIYFQATGQQTAIYVWFIIGIGAILVAYIYIARIRPCIPKEVEKNE